MSSISQSTISPTPKSSFPPNLRLLPNAGSSGLSTWLKNLQKHAPGALVSICSAFVSGEPYLPPTKPDEHGTTILTSNKRPTPQSASQNTSEHDSSAPGINLSPHFDTSNPRSIGSLSTQPINSSTHQPASVMTRVEDIYEHDDQGFLTKSARDQLKIDTRVYEENRKQYTKERSEFFKYVTVDCLHSTTLELLETDSQWADVNLSQDCFLLSALITEKITPASALRSLTSLTKLLTFHQGSKSDAQWSNGLKELVKEFHQDFADDNHPQCISTEKFHTALILYLTKHKDLVQTLLVTGLASLSTLHPEPLYTRLHEYARDSKTYSSVTAHQPNTNSENSHPNTHNQSSNHVLANPRQSNGASEENKSDLSLITLDFPHSRKPGNFTWPSSTTDGNHCSHCVLNRRYFKNHTAANCHDLRYWTDNFGAAAGGGPAPPKPSQPKLASQSTKTHSLLNKVGNQEITVKKSTPTNPYGPIAEVCDELETEIVVKSES